MSRQVFSSSLGKGAATARARAALLSFFVALTLAAFGAQSGFAQSAVGQTVASAAGLPVQTSYARLVGTDQPSDLAVPTIDASNLPVLARGDSDTAQVGDVVLAVGNPLGIGQTVTSGIISAKGRTTELGDGGFEDFIQTDAAINQ